MRVWGYKDTVKAIRDIVMSHPDHVDPGALNGACRYIGDDGESQCIVGVFLVAKVGLSVSDVSLLDSESSTGDAMPIGFTTNSVVLSHLDHGAIRFLSLVQNDQDKGCTWKESYENALPQN